MKTKIFLILINIFLLSCNSDNDSDSAFEVDDSMLSDSLKTIYTADACRIAIRDIYEKDLPTKDEVLIDSEIVSMYYFALVNIYNCNLGVRDTILDSIKIHTFQNPELYSTIVAVSKNADWTQNWKNNEAHTGIEQIDVLFDLYDLEVKEYYDWPYNDTFIIISTYPINIWALANKFENTGKVSYAESNGWVGDGSDILGNRLENMFEIEYHYKWGDCPAGCIGDHWWSFHINYDGTVEYIGEFGQALP